MAINNAKDSSDSGFRLPPSVANLAFDLELTIGFTVVALAFIYIPILSGTIIRTVLGLMMVLFVPGYALIAALFIRNKDIDYIERAALSFGLSIAIVPLIGLALNYTPWGIRLDPIVICLSIFTIACSLIANKRRQELSEAERFSIDFRPLYYQVKAYMIDGHTPFDRALSIVLVASMLLFVIVAAYVIVVPKQGETFTEFYILGPDGSANNYPLNFSQGDTKPIVVGVVNHEQRNVTYDLVIALNDSVNTTILHSETLELADNATWEKTIDLMPGHTGTDMEMEFLLYKDGNLTSPYRECHVWVNVT